MIITKVIIANYVLNVVFYNYESTAESRALHEAWVSADRS